MALQVCSRCRKRRIKCDRQLPACRHCRLADVDCMFWDDSRSQEISCRYLHSLQQKVQSLQLEIQQTAVQGDVNSTDNAFEAGATFPGGQGYHLEVPDLDKLLTPSNSAYLGPSGSARLLQNFLSNAVHWHIANNIEIPANLLTNDRSYLSGPPERQAMPSFAVTNDFRKVDLYSLVPPSAQRAILEYYVKVVAPEYTLLPVEQESALLTYENPLKWISISKDSPAVCTLTIVFTISAALITRDLDSNLATVSLRSREEVQKLSLGDVTIQDDLGTTRWTCTALCALALYEIISPTSGQLWDLLGRAASTMEDLKEDSLLSLSGWDTDLQRLERTLLKLESFATIHFGRPSLFLDTQIHLYLQDIQAPDLISDELYVSSCLHKILQTITTGSALTEISLESLIPLSLQVTSLDSEIELSSARLYAALHPLFTYSERFAGCGILATPSPRIVHITAKSASVIIDHYTQLNQNNMIISVWFAAERILEAGILWAASLVHQHRLSGSGPQYISTKGTGVALGPIIKVSSLLASFAARWRTGSVYVSSWETVIELLWEML